LLALSGTLLGCNSDNLIVPTTGTLELTTATSGAEADPDGYTIQVDAGATQAIGTAGSLRNTNVSAGNHTVQLAGVAPNCGVAGENPRSVSIALGETTKVAFQLTCTASVAPARIAFVSNREGNYDIFTMNVDGSGLINLTSAVTDWERAPTWSPDGSKIAYSTGLSHAIWVMNADGSGKTNVSLTGTDGAAAWSPDGARIAFSRTRNFVTEVFSMNADGSDQTSLATGSDPAWSPDGTQIAFIRNGTLFVMNADGTNQLRVTNPGTESDRAAQWSPDGSRITFIRSDPEDGDGFYVSNLWVTNADGTNPRKLTNYVLPGPIGSIAGHAWSPDGVWLAFGGDVPGGLDILVIHPDGTGQMDLTKNARWYEYGPIWSPDGRRILFSAQPVDPETLVGGSPDVFVMNADGSNVTNLTNHPSIDERAGWQP
jgi:Tol biopolymer transport system component